MADQPSNTAPASRFATADVWFAVSSLVILWAFVALPWLANTSALSFMRGFGQLPSTVNGQLSLLPAIGVAGLLAFALVAWGIARPQHKRIAGFVGLLVAALAWFYYITFINGNADAGAAIRYAGAGFWFALCGAAGLIIQAVAPRPRYVRQADGTLLQSVPQNNAGRNLLFRAALAPVNAALAPFRMGCALLALGFGLTAGCALFVPIAFQSILDTVRNTTLRSYVRILEVQGSEALKVITYETTVTANAVVTREIPGLLAFAFSESAELRGTVRIALGADLQNNKTGLLYCEIDTDSLQLFVGRAPFAGAAFDPKAIERIAFDNFKGQASEIAIRDHWPLAKERLRDNFIAWGLGFEVPEIPSITQCPDLPAAAPATP
jgi:hypothetical protein